MLLCDESGRTVTFWLQTVVYSDNSRFMFGLSLPELDRIQQPGNRMLHINIIK